MLAGSQLQVSRSALLEKRRSGKLASSVSGRCATSANLPQHGAG